MADDIDRKFLTWIVHTEDKNKHTVEVRFKQKRADSNAPVTFYVKLEDPAITIADTDLEALRIKLNKTLNAVNKIEWVPMLMVRAERLPMSLDSTMPIGGVGGLGLTIGCYQQGTMAGGKKFWRATCKIGGREDSDGVRWRTFDGEPYNKARDETLDQRGNGFGVAIVVDTPEVRTGLLRIVSSLNTMGARLAAFINDDDFGNLLPEVSLEEWADGLNR